MTNKKKKLQTIRTKLALLFLSLVTYGRLNTALQVLEPCVTCLSIGIDWYQYRPSKK